VREVLTINVGHNSGTLSEIPGNVKRGHETNDAVTPTRNSKSEGNTRPQERQGKWHQSKPKRSFGLPPPFSVTTSLRHPNDFFASPRGFSNRGEAFNQKMRDAPKGKEEKPRTEPEIRHRSRLRRKPHDRGKLAKAEIK